VIEMKLDVEMLIKNYLPLFIIIGLVMLLATFLGPLGVILMLAGIVFIGYLVYDYIKKQM